MCLLLSLPPEILANVFDYVTFKEVGKVDRALTQGNLRKKWMSVIKQTLLPYRCEIRSLNMTTFVIKREIKLQGLLFCSYIATGSNLRKLIDIHPSVAELCLGYQRIYDDCLLTSLIAKCSCLRKLDVYGTYIKDSFLFELAKMNATLDYLDLSYCYSVSDEGVVAVVSKHVHLTQLLLRCNHKLTDLTLDAILSNLTKLQRLDVWGCFRMTEDRTRLLYRPL